MMSKRVVQAAWMAALLLSGSCAKPLTELVVVVRADVPDLSSVTIAVTTPAGAVAFDETETVSGPEALPLTLSLTRDRAPFGPVTVRVVGAGSASGRIERTVSTSFVEGSRRRLEILLEGACGGTSCSPSETCVAGTCGAANVDPASLPVFDGTVPTVDAQAPSLDAGAPDTGTPDAGPPDAGPPDAGPPDAGPRPCDGLCAGTELCVYDQCLARPWTSVAVGDGHVCIVAEAPGPVLCTGANANGQLGDGTTTSSPRWVRVSGLADAVEVSAGRGHTCAVTAGGNVLCWGGNEALQLGAPGTVARSEVPVAIAGLSGTSVHVSAGENHNCAAVDGALYCWGGNTVGQLGDGTTTSRAEIGMPIGTPGRPMFGGVTSVAAGSNFTCAIDGVALFCWGNNAQGQLGDGTTTPRRVPTAVSAPTATDPVQVVVGRSHACARIRRGAVACWGNNSVGQLGNGTTMSRGSGDLTTDFGVAASLGSGTQHVVARRSDGQVWGWGDNLARQLDPMLPAVNSMPARLGGAVLTDALWAGYSTSCWWTSGVGPTCIGRVALP